MGRMLVIAILVLAAQLLSGCGLPGWRSGSPAAVDAAAGYCDDVGGRRHPANRTDRFDSVRMRHEYIGDDDVGTKLLEQVDGELDSNLALRGELARVIRELRPQVVLGHDPWKRYRLHPDHRHAGLLACEGIVAARDPHFFKEHGLAHHRPEVLLLWEADEVNHFEDVSLFVDTKLHALEAHASQFESTMKATDESGMEVFRRRIRERVADLGRPMGLGAATSVFVRCLPLERVGRGGFYRH